MLKENGIFIQLFSLNIRSADGSFLRKIVLLLGYYNHTIVYKHTSFKSSSSNRLILSAFSVKERFHFLDLHKRLIVYYATML